MRIRRAARAILLTPAGEVLLLRFELGPVTVWALPGGGLEDGEAHEDALRRELEEELGFTGYAMGPHVWTRTHIVPFLDGRWDGQREQAYLVPTARFEPTPRLSPEQLRAEHVYEMRWWAIPEIRLATGRGTLFAPHHLASHLTDLAEHGPPPTPIDVEV